VLDDLEASIVMLNETHHIVKELIGQGLSLDAIKALDPLNSYTEKWN